MRSRGYVPMPRHGATFAFHTDGGGNVWLNLRWLADVIRGYEAGGQSLSSPEPSEERKAFEALAVLEASVRQVDAEAVATFERRSRGL